MDEKDSWSILLEYLKLAIALSTAIIAAAAAFYVDNSKIPSGHLVICSLEIPARYLLFVGVAAFVLVLASALLTMGFLSNHFVKFPTAAKSSSTAWAKAATAAAAAARASVAAIQAKGAEEAARAADDTGRANAQLAAEQAATLAADAKTEAETAANAVTQTQPRKSTHSAWAIRFANASMIFLLIAVSALALFFYTRSQVASAGPEASIGRSIEGRSIEGGARRGAILDFF